MKLLKAIKKHFDSIANNLDEGRWLLAIIKYIVTIASIGGAIIGAILLCQIVYENISYIILVVVGFLCLVALFRYCFPTKAEQQETTPQQVIASPNNIIMQDPIQLNNTYQKIRSCLCIVIGDIYEIINVRKPASYSQLDAPTHFDVVANTPIYHFLLSKNGETEDAYTIMGIIQNTIEQKLDNRELPGITQTSFFYNGVHYPILMVDNVYEHIGNYIQVDIAVASAYYCKYREQRIYNNMSQTSIVDPSDFDF